MIYLAMRGRLTAFDLATDQKVWDNTYDGFCCERQEITPDGLTIVAGAKPKKILYPLGAQNGKPKRKNPGPGKGGGKKVARTRGRTGVMDPHRGPHDGG